MRFWNRLRLRARRSRRELDLAGEIRLHRQMLEEEFVRGGMSPADAARAAARQFGHAGEATNLSRDEWSLPRFDAIAKDVRFAGRMMLRHPLLTIAAVLTVAFGVGANTAILSILETVLLNPLGMPHADRVMVARTHVDRLHMMNGPASPADFRDLQSLTDVFSATAAASVRTFVYDSGGEAIRLVGRSVTPDFFAVFDARPALGRFFTADDSQTVVLSYRAWQSDFGGDAGAIGRAITLDGKTHRIVGVAPVDFRYPTDAALYIPLRIDAASYAQGHGYNMNLTLLARLLAGVTPQAAIARVARFSAAQQTADTQEGRDMAKLGYGLTLDPFSVYLSGDLRRPLWLLWAAALVVLATGCANVAGLLLTRSSGRRKEIAIRIALGATRWQIVRQLLFESLFLAAAGGLAGLAMARLAVALTTRVPLPGKETLALVALDRHMLLYGMALAMASGLVFGLVPALQLVRGNQAGDMARSRRRWFQDIFIIAEVAGAFVLLTMTGLLLRSLWTVQQIQPGFDYRHLTTAYYTKPKNDRTFEARLSANLKASPGVESAALAYPVPFSQGGLTSGFGIRNREPRPGEPEFHGEAYFVSADYFQTLRIPVLAGRHFTAADGASAPLVCMIDRRLAGRFFPNQNPLGQELRMYKDWCRIVGIAAAIRADGLEDDPRPVVYYSLPQVDFFPQAAVVLRSQTPAAQLVRTVIHRVNSSVPVYDVQTIEQRMDGQLGIRRVMAVLLAIFAAISLLLASIGIYGVIAQVVAEHTREIGVRMALGARPGQILRHFLTQGARAAGVGLLLGGAVTISLHKWTSALLYQVSGFDGAAIGVALGGIVVVLLLAVWWPARRASRIDPQSALRYE